MEKSNMTETKDQRKGWLKDLKVGDEVFIVISRGVLGNNRILTTIKKITPTGRINAGGKQFPPTGKVYANYVFTELEQATEELISEHINNVKKHKMVEKLNEKIQAGILNKMALNDLEIIQREFSKYE